MLKKSLFNISFVSAGNIFNAILGFVFLSAVAKTLSVDLFGKYALVTSILVAASKLLDFGTNSIYVSDSITKDSKMKEVFLFTKIILLAVAVPISLLILNILGLLSLEISVLFIVGLVGYGINYTLFAIFQKVQDFKFTVLINTIPGIIKGTIGVLIFLGIASLDFTQAFGIFALSITSSAILFIALPEEYKRISFTTKGWFEFLKNAWAAGTSLMIRVSWGAISNSILKIAKTFTDVGIFSLANKIANIFSLVSMSIFTVILPKNAIKKRDKELYDYKETVLISIGVLIMAVGAIVAGKVFIIFVFGDKFAASLPILNILIVAYALGAINHFLETYFYIEENTKGLLGITLLNLGFFLILAFILVPIKGLMGLAYTQLISSAIALAISAYVIQQKYLPK